MNELLIFFCVLSIIFSVLVIASKNPIHSILSLIMVFCCVTFILIVLDLEFIAIMFLIVYVGAIAVLFLFVVMMLNIKILESDGSLLKFAAICLSVMGLLSFIFFGSIFNFSQFVEFLNLSDIINQQGYTVEEYIVYPNTQELLDKIAIYNVTKDFGNTIFRYSEEDAQDLGERMLLFCLMENPSTVEKYFNLFLDRYADEYEDICFEEYRTLSQWQEDIIPISAAVLYIKELISPGTVPSDYWELVSLLDTIDDDLEYKLLLSVLIEDFLKNAPDKEFLLIYLLTEELVGMDPDIMSDFDACVLSKQLYEARSMYLANSHLAKLMLQDLFTCERITSIEYQPPGHFLQFNQISNIVLFGWLLYTQNFFVFLIISFILLLAMVGSIVLVLNQNVNVRRQIIFRQTSKKLKESICLRINNR